MPVGVETLDEFGNSGEGRREAVVVLVLSFRSSSALATAYGLSVTGTMLIDTILM